MRSIFLPVRQLRQSHPPWDQVPFQRDPLVCEDRLDRGRLALLSTAKKETAEKPPKERKPESMIRLLPQFPSQLNMCLMLEKINSVIIIKIRLQHQVLLESDSLLAHKAPEKNKTKKIPHPPNTNPCSQKKRRAKFKFIRLETIWFENNILKK